MRTNGRRSFISTVLRLNSDACLTSLIETLVAVASQLPWVLIRGGANGKQHPSTEKREHVASISQIKITLDGQAKEWNAQEIKNIPIRRLVPEDFLQVSRSAYEEMQVALSSICYIGAERLGPREVYSGSTPAVIPDVGAHGEHTALCLEQFKDASCNPGVRLDGVADNVRLTVSAWMKQLFPGVGFDTSPVEGTNLILMGIRTSPKGEPFRPTNVGYGVTHVLPIIVGCVAAKPGTILLIENPETHLHPSAQSLVGGFLARASSRGVQVIVETHSDHVLNGVRRAIRDRKLNAPDSKIFFFEAGIGTNNEPLTSVAAIDIDEQGGIANWPPGFFDQFETDLDHIFGE